MPHNVLTRALIASAVLTGLAAPAAADEASVATTAIVEQPALDAARDGLRDELAAGLKGEQPGEIAVQGVEITELYVNTGAEKKMGVTIPPAVIAEAKTAIE